MVNARRNVDRFAPVSASMIRFTILATNNQIEPCLDEVEVYSAATAGRPAAPKRRRGQCRGRRNGVVRIPGRRDPQDRSSQ